MEIKTHINSLFNSVTYHLESIVIDPGDIEDIKDISAVLLTHGHFDHIYGLNNLLEINPNAVVFTNEEGAKMLTNDRLNISKYYNTPFIFNYPSRIRLINDQEEIILTSSLVAKAIFTPGHNPSCITWIIENALFTGDAYIPNLKTVINLPRGNKKQAEDSIRLIEELAIGRIIYPGHKV